ncbi:hypothetical protein CLOP_g2630 [Closterium sp. NIES-67]|nr:hypothetical protein CLOP_g2630 [Closterium sp. NIES-67]
MGGDDRTAGITPATPLLDSSSGDTSSSSSYTPPASTATAAATSAATAGVPFSSSLRLPRLQSLILLSVVAYAAVIGFSLSVSLNLPATTAQLDASSSSGHVDASGADGGGIGGGNGGSVSRGRNAITIGGVFWEPWRLFSSGGEGTAGLFSAASRESADGYHEKENEDFWGEGSRRWGKAGAREGGLARGDGQGERGEAGDGGKGGGAAGAAGESGAAEAWGRGSGKGGWLGGGAAGGDGVAEDDGTGGAHGGMQRSRQAWGKSGEEGGGSDEQSMLQQLLALAEDESGGGEREGEVVDEEEERLRAREEEEREKENELEPLKVFLLPLIPEYNFGMLQQFADQGLWHNIHLPRGMPASWLPFAPSPPASPDFPASPAPPSSPFTSSPLSSSTSSSSRLLPSHPPSSSGSPANVPPLPPLNTPALALPAAAADGGGDGGGNGSVSSGGSMGVAGSAVVVTESGSKGGRNKEEEEEEEEKGEKGEKGEEEKEEGEVGRREAARRRRRLLGGGGGGGGGSGGGVVRQEDRGEAGRGVGVTQGRRDASGGAGASVGAGDLSHSSIIDRGAWVRGGSTVSIARYSALPYELQHSAEYWLTLSLLSGAPSVEVVGEEQQADVVFVPFFSSLALLHTSLNHSSWTHFNALQERLYQGITGSSAWVRRGGRGFVIPAGHPLSVDPIIERLTHATFLAVDFCFHPRQVLRSSKDVIVPYVPVVGVYHGDPGDFSHRRTLLFFQSHLLTRSHVSRCRAGGCGSGCMRCWRTRRQ